MLQKIDPPPSRHIDINPLYLDDDPPGPARGRLAAGRHLGRRVGQLPRAGLRQDRHRPVHRDGQVEHDYAWYACFVPATATSKPIVVVVTVEQGGFGAVAAAPVARQILSQWFFGKPGPYTAGSLDDAVSAHRRSPPPRRPVAPRAARCLLFDPLLLLAALGLVACSLVTLNGAVGSRRTTPSARRSTPAIGLLLALRAQPLRLLAAARVQVRAVYGVMIALNLVVYGMRADRRARAAGSRCRASASSPRSSARCC